MDKVKVAQITAAPVARRGHPGRPVSAVRLSRGDPRGHRAHAADGANRRPDDIVWCPICCPAPASTIACAELGDKQNWFDSSDLSTMYHATYGPEFYRVLHQAVHAEFRLRKASAHASAIYRPWTLRSKHLRQVASALFNGLKLPVLRWQLDHRAGRARVVPGQGRPWATGSQATTTALAWLGQAINRTLCPARRVPSDEPPQQPPFVCLWTSSGDDDLTIEEIGRRGRLPAPSGRNWWAPGGAAAASRYSRWRDCFGGRAWPHLLTSGIGPGRAPPMWRAGLSE
jgi:hypothetical protein